MTALEITRRVSSCVRPAGRTQGAAAGVLYALVTLAVLVIVPFHIIGCAQLFVGGPKLSVASLAPIYAAEALLAIWLAPQRFRPLHLRGCRRLWNSAPLSLKFALITVMGTYIFFALETLTGFPAGVDTQTYHLPKVLTWLQTGSLLAAKNAGWRVALPANAEIAAALSLATKWQALSGLPNLMSAAVLGLSVFLLATRITGNEIAALSSAVLVLTTPIVVFQSVMPYVDIYGTAYLLASLALAHNASGLSGARTLLIACAAGLSVGSKPVFYAFVALSIPLIVYELAKRTPKSLWVRRLIVFTLGVLLCSGFWFLRAWIQDGNPFYPIQLRIGALDLKGVPVEQITPDSYQLQWVQHPSDIVVYPWTEWTRAGYNYDEQKGLGFGFATFVPIATLYAFLTCFRRGRDNPAACRLLLLLASFVVLWATYMQGVLRFALPILALAWAITSLLFCRLWQRYQRSTGAIVLFCTAGTCLCCLAFPAYRLYGRASVHDWSRARFYGYNPIVDHLPPGSRILNRTRLGIDFPLAGAHLTNVVVQEYPPEFTAAFLSARRIDYIVTAEDLNADDRLLMRSGAQLIYRGSGKSWGGYVGPEWRLYRWPHTR